MIVPLGTCKGWAMSQVADRRPASLKWYINGYSGNDNILRAAATIMQASLDENANKLTFTDISLERRLVHEPARMIFRST